MAEAGIGLMFDPVLGNMSVDYDCSESINKTGATLAIIVSSISSYRVNYSGITTLLIR